VRSVDATGAGDAFTAALTVSLIEGRSPGEAGRYASAAAALATTAAGAWAGMSNRQQIEELLSRHP
jgi:ribokinase